MNSPDGFHREPLNPCEPIQAAQARRMMHRLRLTPAEIIAAFDAMPPDDACQLAQDVLSHAIRRRMIAVHERKV